MDADATLGRCLRSIEAQKYGPLEVLVQDGLSSDDTLEIAKSFGDQGLAVSVQSEKDSGLYEAINKGLKRIDGEFILILGADDELMPGALETLCAAAEREKADIYVGSALNCAPNWQEVFFPAPFEPFAILQNCSFSHNAMFASKYAYKVIGLYDESYKIAADSRWVHKALLSDLRFAAINATVVKFHLGGMSCVNPELVMSESCRTLMESFPGLSRDDALYLLLMAKGWDSAERLTEILARYPDNEALRDAAVRAAEYAPYGPQRALDRAASNADSVSPSFFKRLVTKTRKLRHAFS